jgi:hypothetical protein
MKIPTNPFPGKGEDLPCGVKKHTPQGKGGDDNLGEDE